MTKDYLRQICKSYLNRSKVYKNCNTIEEFESMVDHAHEDIFEMVRYFRDTDIDTYHMLWDSTKAKQRDIIEAYLDMSYNPDASVLTEIDPLTIIVMAKYAGAAALTFGTAFILNREFQKKTTKFASGVGSALESIGETLVKHGRYWKFRYAVIYKNVEECYKQAGISSDIDISKFAYGSDSFISTARGKKQSAILRTCFVDFSIDSIVLLSKAYFLCLKNNGEFETVAGLNPEGIYRSIKHSNLSTACTDLHKQLEKSFSTFDDLLDFVYDDNEIEKKNKHQEMRSKLFEQRNQVRNVRSKEQFKKFK